MRRIAGVVCIVALLAVVRPVRAEDDAKVKAVIAKAIEKHGGAENLNKLKASTLKSKGKFYGMGDGIEYTSETSIQLPNRIRTEVEGDTNGMKFKFVQVVDGNKGWMKFGDNTDELSKEQLAESREQLHVANVSRLSVLNGKGYKLSSLGASKVGDKETVGVGVAHEGFRDVSLFFDKESGLLLKVESRGKDPRTDDKEFTVTSTYGDYKKVDGVMVAHKVNIKRDGKKYIEAEVTEAKFSEKLGDGVFAKP